MRKTHLNLHSYVLIVVGLIFLINSETWAVEEEQKKSISSSSYTRPTSELTPAPNISLTDLSKVEVSTSGTSLPARTSPLSSHEIMYGNHSMFDITKSVLDNVTYYFDQLTKIKIPRSLLQNVVKYSFERSPGIQAGYATQITVTFESGIEMILNFRPKVVFVP